MPINVVDTGMATIYVGNAAASLADLPDQIVQVCITSPPYFGVRDYQCEGQIGLESTPEEYVARLVGVFAAVRRVLREDGVLWLNLGDSYAASGNGGGSGKQLTNVGANMPPKRAPAGLKPKDLVGIPWRVALALQADGWYLRQDIIWHKPNPMPESVTDRCTKAHEHLFLLAKSPNYYWDRAAMQEPVETPRAAGNRRHKGTAAYLAGDGRRRTAAGLTAAAAALAYKTRNRRSVWTIAPSTYRGAHFATFPPALVELPLLATSRPGDLVLDPFAGSGTVGAVAIQHGRYPILCELNRDYVGLILERIA